MAEQIKYRTNGGAAVDIYAAPYQDGSAVRKPQQLPEERPVKQPVRKVRAKVAISPFAAVGAVVAVMLLTLVVLAQIRLFELKSEESRLTTQLQDLKQQVGVLRSEFESKIDLREIESEAKALGMRKPTSSQTVYLSIDGADSAEVLHQQQKGFFGTLWDAVSDGFRGIRAYFG